MGNMYRLTCCGFSLLYLVTLGIAHDLAPTPSSVNPFLKPQDILRRTARSPHYNHGHYYAGNSYYNPYQSNYYNPGYSNRDWQWNGYYAQTNLPYDNFAYPTCSDTTKRVAVITDTSYLRNRQTVNIRVQCDKCIFMANYMYSQMVQTTLNKSDYLVLISGPESYPFNISGIISDTEMLRNLSLKTNLFIATVPVSKTLTSERVYNDSVDANSRIRDLDVEDMRILDLEALYETMVANNVPDFDKYQFCAWINEALRKAENGGGSTATTKTATETTTTTTSEDTTSATSATSEDTTSATSEGTSATSESTTMTTTTTEGTTSATSTTSEDTTSATSEGTSATSESTTTTTTTTEGTTEGTTSATSTTEDGGGDTSRDDGGEETSDGGDGDTTAEDVTGAVDETSAAN